MASVLQPVSLLECEVYGISEEISEYRIGSDMISPEESLPDTSSRHWYDENVSFLDPSHDFWNEVDVAELLLEGTDFLSCRSPSSESFFSCLSPAACHAYPYDPQVVLSATGCAAPSRAWPLPVLGSRSTIFFQCMLDGVHALYLGITENLRSAASYLEKLFTAHTLECCLSCTKQPPGTTRSQQSRISFISLAGIGKCVARAFFVTC